MESPTTAPVADDSCHARRVVGDARLEVPRKPQAIASQIEARRRHGQRPDGLQDVGTLPRLLLVRAEEPVSLRPTSEPPSRNPGAARALLRELEARRLAAMRANNVAALENMSSAGMIYVHESGRLYHLEEYLKALSAGVLVYDRDVELAEEEVTLADTALIATGLMAGHGKLGGRPQNFQVRYTAVWLFVDHDWRLALIQKTPISRRAPPIEHSQRRVSGRALPAQPSRRKSKAQS